MPGSTPTRTRWRPTWQRATCTPSATRPTATRPATDEAGDGAVGDDEVRDEGAVGGPGPTLPGICGVCPICRGHALVQARHPEVAAHLADAARSLSRALATFADLVEAEPAATPDPDDRATDTFRPIVLDDEEGEAR